MKKLLYLIILSSCFVYSQESIFIGDNVYSKTKNWKFRGSDKYLESIEVSVAKNSSYGYLILSINTESFSDGYLNGNVIIYLNDNTTIKCVNRGKNDIANGVLTAILNLNPSEIQRLSKSRILAIRFTVNDIFESRNIIVNNEITNIGWENGEAVFKKEYYKTNEEIKELFNN